MAKYLVTGGCGFIGGHLVARLLDSGHGVTVLDDGSSGDPADLSPQAELIIGDVADRATVAGAMDGIDGCFHLAGVVSVDRALDDRTGTARTNLLGTVAVLEAAGRARNGPVPVVYASSGAVYGEHPPMPLSEDASCAPNSAYGVDKLAGELHARVADAVHGVPVTSFRLFNVYGPRQSPASPYAGVISEFAASIERGEPVTIYGDGEQVRDFVYVSDCLWYLLAAMQAPAKGAPVYNICTGSGLRVNALADLVGDLLGRPVEKTYAAPRLGDIATAVGNPSRAIAAFCIACDTPLLEGLRRTLDARRP